MKMNQHKNEPVELDMGGLTTNPDCEVDEESPVSHFYNSYAYLSSLQKDWSQTQQPKIQPHPPLQQCKPQPPTPLFFTTPLTSRTPTSTLRRRNILLQEEEELNLSPCKCSCCSDHFIKNAQVTLAQRRLESELARVCCERDALAIQVEQLRMQILATELGRLDTKMGQHQSQTQNGSSVLSVNKLRSMAVGGLCSEGDPSGDEGDDDQIQLRDMISVVDSEVVNVTSVLQQNLETRSAEISATDNDNVGRVVTTNYPLLASGSGMYHGPVYPDPEELDRQIRSVGMEETQKLLDMTSEIETMVDQKNAEEDQRSDEEEGELKQEREEEEYFEDEVAMISAHLIPQKVDDNVPLTRSVQTLYL